MNERTEPDEATHKADEVDAEKAHVADRAPRTDKARLAEAQGSQRQTVKRSPGTMRRWMRSGRTSRAKGLSIDGAQTCGTVCVTADHWR